MSQSHNHALVIGVADYQNITKLPLEVINDAQAIHDVLVDPSYCAYAEENVKLLINPDATKEYMLAAFADLEKKVQPSSSVVIFFSGHGGFIPTGDHQNAYLLPVDVKDNSFREMAETAISGDQFTRFLKRLSAQQILVIFDSCHAGGVGETKSVSKNLQFQHGLSEDYYEKAIGSNTRGRVILASSRETEYSWVTPGDQNSLFTKHLLAGLRGGAARDDGYIRVFHLYEYLQPLVLQEKSIQHPVFKGKLEENFPVAFNEAHKSSAPATALDDGFEFDVYISCLEDSEDTYWVEDELVPRLRQEGLKFGITYDDKRGQSLSKITDVQRAMTASRWTVIMLSDQYLENNIANFEHDMAQSRGVEEGQWPVIPVIRNQITKITPWRLKMLAGVNLSIERRYEQRLTGLIEALKHPPPSM